MKVTTVSGKIFDYDHLVVLDIVKNLNKEQRESIKVECEKNGCGGFVTIGKIPGAGLMMAEAYLTYYFGYGINDNDPKREPQWFVVKKDEAERILKIRNHPMVWAFGDYWICYDEPENFYWHWNKLSHEEEDGVDQFEEWLVDLLYKYGGRDECIGYLKDKLSKIIIPQRSDFFAPKENIVKAHDLWVNDTTPPTEKEYINAVESAITSIRKHEKAILEFETWADNWYIVHRPDISPVRQDTHKTSEDDVHGIRKHTVPKIIRQISGIKLKDWLAEHGLSQGKAAEICGVSPRTFRRWVAENPSIPKGMWELLRSKISNSL